MCIKWETVEATLFIYFFLGKDKIIKQCQTKNGA